MSGPCMCGDPFCHSCGPVQGNCKCSNSGRWSADGGCEDPAVCAEADRKVCEAMAKACQEEDEFFKNNSIQWEQFRKEEEKE